VESVPPDFTPSWTVRPYEPGDETQLVELYARVFGRPRPVEVWRWKLQGRPAPYPTVWVAATSEGRIAGQYGGIPLGLQIGGQVYPAVHAVEAMTDPAFRRQGMLTRLGEAAHGGWAAAGQVAVLGLPNDQWGTRNYALGYRPLFPLAWLRFPLHAERAVARTAQIPRPLAGPVAALGAAGSGVWRGLARGAMRRQMGGAAGAVEDVTGPDPALDRLWARAAPHYPHLVVRDSGWVDWRFLRAATGAYRVLLARAGGEPVAYLAYRLVESLERVTGYLADVFMTPDGAAGAAALLDAALRDLAGRGAATVLTTGVPGSALYGLLRACGFWPMRHGFQFEIVPLAPLIQPAALADPRAWYLTAGDFDVI
jgi:hypothetical protein